MSILSLVKKLAVAAVAGIVGVGFLLLSLPGYIGESDTPIAYVSAVRTAVAQSSAITAIEPLAVREADARLNGLVVNGQKGSALNARLITDSASDYTSNVRFISQLPHMPSGCEIVSLEIALDSMGFEIESEELFDEYIEVDGNFEEGYIADPYGYDGGGFPPAIAKAANGYLKEADSHKRAFDLTGSDFESLEALVEAGYPVLVWTTLDMQEPWFDWGTTWWYNEHCLVMYGLEEDNVLASNPLEGLVAYDRDTFKEVYEQCGQRALFIH